MVVLTDHLLSGNKNSQKVHIQTEQVSLTKNQKSEEIERKDQSTTRSERRLFI